MFSCRAMRTNLNAASLPTWPLPTCSSTQGISLLFSVHRPSIRCPLIAVGNSALGRSRCTFPWVCLRVRVCMYVSVRVRGYTAIRELSVVIKYNIQDHVRVMYSHVLSLFSSLPFFSSLFFFFFLYSYLHVDASLRCHALTPGLKMPAHLLVSQKEASDPLAHRV